MAWAGSLIFAAFMLTPAIRAVGPAGGAIMQQLMRVQKMQRFLIALMALTVLSGLALYWRDISAMGAGWARTGPGATFAAGAVFALLTAIVGIHVNAKAAGKLGVLSAAIQAGGKHPSAEQAAELGRLQLRLARGSAVSTTFIILAVACMGIARYVP
ncbi:MAG TPA: hypothetical protein VGO46_02765 [Gemmatimonadaceae bacterium]|nr:hypothetical protein [Gemmatimonadaceae bacterium]